jgi:hypothetical protein
MFVARRPYTLPSVTSALATFDAEIIRLFARRP